ncbi:hypothetical protein FRB90_008852, partial [Tulasnella sp. 427]
VVTKLPDRFASISGKTLAIDATLLTQRFWFSQDSHTYRHVRGWFRLISELRRSDVTVTHKRKSARKLVAARAALEARRLRRLERILSIEERYRNLGVAMGEDAAAQVMELVSRSTARPPHRCCSSAFSAGELGTVNPKPDYRPPTSNSLPATRDISKASYLKRLAVLYRDYRRNTQSEALATVASTPPTDVDEPMSRFEELQEGSKPAPEATRHTPFSERTSLKTSETTSDAPVSSSEVQTDGLSAQEPSSDAEAGVTFSKVQAKLITDESQVWTFILNEAPKTSQGQKQHTDEVIQRLRKLVLESQNLLESYSKRQSPPSSVTYDESRTILNALCVPVVEAPYPYEAEGVAASLCINGLADFVASEDTDVLIYGATLLRNATTRDEPLLRISGEEVRQALDLSPQSFIDFALLLGSDFTERLHGLGPTRATKLIQTFGTIEDILLSERSKDEKGRRFLPEPKLTQEEYMQQIADGRAVFSSLPPIPAEWEGLFAE